MLFSDLNTNGPPSKIRKGEAKILITDDNTVEAQPKKRKNTGTYNIGFLKALERLGII